MPKIALLGRMGSGKSELAKRLIEHFGAAKVALGDALKEQVVQYGLVPDGKIDKSRDRATLQNYGQFRRGEVRAFDYHNGHAKLIRFDGIDDVDDYDRAFIIRNINAPGYLGRDIGLAYADFWIDLLAPTVADLALQGTSIVNDDIRRMNEWQAFKDWGFTMVKVQCDEEIRIQRLIARDGGYDASRMNDISESETDHLPYDVLIDNNDTIERAWRTLLGVI